MSDADLPPNGLVRDGTPCGEDLICVNQTCTSLFPYIDTSKCPSNHNNLECSGHGVRDHCHLPIIECTNLFIFFSIAQI